MVEVAAEVVVGGLPLLPSWCGAAAKDQIEKLGNIGVWPTTALNDKKLGGKETEEEKRNKEGEVDGAPRVFVEKRWVLPGQI